MQAPASRPPSRRKRRSRAELTSRILDAARAEFELHGPRGATTAAIAQRADVTEAQLFRYFSTKAELFREAVFAPLNHHFADYEARRETEFPQDEDLREAAQRYIVELRHMLGDNGKLLLALLMARADPADGAPPLGEIESLAAYFARGAELMRQRAGGKALVDAKLMVRVSFAAMLGVTLFSEWLFPPGLADDAAIEAAVIAFVLDGISAGHAPSAPNKGRETP